MSNVSNCQRFAWFLFVFIQYSSRIMAIVKRTGMKNLTFAQHYKFYQELFGFVRFISWISCSHFAPKNMDKRSMDLMNINNKNPVSLIALNCIQTSLNIQRKYVKEYFLFIDDQLKKKCNIILLQLSISYKNVKLLATCALLFKA